jgi:hypothetical protein
VDLGEQALRLLAALALEDAVPVLAALALLGLGAAAVVGMLVVPFVHRRLVTFHRARHGPKVCR